MKQSRAIPSEKLKPIKIKIKKYFRFNDNLIMHFIYLLIMYNKLLLIYSNNHS